MSALLETTTLRVDIGGVPCVDGLSMVTSGDHVVILGAPSGLFEAVSGTLVGARTSALLRLDPLLNERQPDVVTFSGGVAEYIYRRQKRDFGDLGGALADAILERVQKWGPRIAQPEQGIRATVVGASQYTVQVSGSTIFVAPQSVLPLRNIPVITPVLPLDDDVLNPAQISAAVRRALACFDLGDGERAVALCYRWRGSATFARLDQFCRGVIDGVAAILARGLPLVMVGDGDIGGLVGIHCDQVNSGANPIVSIDGIVLNEFDFIDVGAMLETSGAVPVVIKSLVFPGSAALGRSETGSAQSLPALRSGSDI